MNGEQRVLQLVEKLVDLPRLTIEGVAEVIGARFLDAPEMGTEYFTAAVAAGSRDGLFEAVELRLPTEHAPDAGDGLLILRLEPDRVPALGKLHRAIGARFGPSSGVLPADLECPDGTDYWCYPVPGGELRLGFVEGALDRPAVLVLDRIRPPGQGPDPRRVERKVVALAERDQAHLYLVLDGARLPDLLERLAGFDVEAERVFYQKELPGDLDPATLPYLVRCERDSALSRWFFDEVWGRGAAILIVSRADQRTIARHLTRQLLVQTDGGEELYFRFYDPRVLRPFIPTCDPEQIAHLYGPILRFVMEGESHDIVSFRRASDKDAQN